jgi:hypothetical protein
MNAFLGPLGSHLNYLNHIALQNCSDYFQLAKAQEERSSQLSTSDKYERLRYFLNSIESLNNILEYFYHEYKSEEGWPEIICPQILGNMRKKHSIFENIEQVANAYKHCIRRKSASLHASDLQSPQIIISIIEGNVSVKYEFDSIECENTIMGEAYRFWVGYSQKPDKALLIP